MEYSSTIIKRTTAKNYQQHRKQTAHIKNASCNHFPAQSVILLTVIMMLISACSESGLDNTILVNNDNTSEETPTNDTDNPTDTDPPVQELPIEDPSSENPPFTDNPSENPDDQTSTPAGPIPQLPSIAYNYANIDLPDHYFIDNMPGGAPGDPGQLAAIDLDNTPANNPITDTGATLGRVLFYDRRLSANGSISCASCHQQEHGFSDPRTLSLGFAGGETRRHSMGLANARFYSSGAFFWDERASTLEEQVLKPFQDPVEMGLSLEQLVTLVSEQDYYTDLFRDAFGDDTVTGDRIARALAQFVRSIVSTGTRYDLARPAVDAPTTPFPSFTPQENEGKNLFFRARDVGNGDRVSCAACHSTEAFANTENRSRSNSIATNNGLDLASIDDLGVFEASNNPNDLGKFKTPSLINIAITAPYMHDGRFTHLDQVIDHYSNGVQDHPNLSPQLRGPNGQPAQFNSAIAKKLRLSPSWPP